MGFKVKIYEGTNLKWNSTCCVEVKGGDLLKERLKNTDVGYMCLGFLHGLLGQTGSNPVW